MYSDFANLDVPDKQEVSLQSQTQVHACSICGKNFPSNQQLSLHLFKSHGVKNVCRKYVWDTHCPVCMTDFRSRERVINHVRYRSKICRDYLFAGPPALSDEQAEELDVTESQRNREMYVRNQRRHCTDDRPAFRIPGPLSLLSTDAPSQHHPFGCGHNYRFPICETF